MSSKILSATVVGIDAHLLEVEADTKGGGEMGVIAIVGLPDTAVSEAKERVRSAIKNCDFNFPKIKLTINLAPAHLKKQGPGLDLPIAVSILLNSGTLKKEENYENSIFLGELALNGDLRPVSGVLPIALMAKKEGIKTLYVPAENANEAKMIKELEVIPIKNLKDLVFHLQKRKSVEPLPYKHPKLLNRKTEDDMAYVKGQEYAKRALEIAAAGGHNLLMSGPPGSGKSMLAKALSSILPDLTLNESLDITKIYSVAGELIDNEGLVKSRPFRAPHHTASGVALTGGGTKPRPGEISLAHRGVLFLDELPEFSKHILENLRQPLEDGIVNVSRATGAVSYPANFMLIAAMNPCPCGYYFDDDKECTCGASQVINYQKKVSGPILDRIDMHIKVPRIKFEKITNKETSEPSKNIKQRVEESRLKQTKRFKEKPFKMNSEMDSKTVSEICEINSESEQILKMAVEKMSLSPRSYFKILKIARTIADLENSASIETHHLSEALQYRKTES